jgi:hypothetical protein
MITMKAGKYWIGDLCYVMKDIWQPICDKFFDHKFTGAGDIDGREFVMFPTAFGDGNYPSNIGKSFPVDAGVIGCIKVSDIKDNTANLELGEVVEFAEDFVCSEDHGTLTFGHVEVYTNDYNDDEDPYYDCYYNSDDENDNVDERQEWHDYDPDC